MVIERFQQVQRFEIVGTAFSGLSAPMWIAQIYESMAMACGSRLLRWMASTSVAGIGFLEGAGECQGVAQIAETVGVRVAFLTAIILHRGLPGGPAWTRSPDEEKKMRARCLSFSASRQNRWLPLVLLVSRVRNGLPVHG